MQTMSSAEDEDKVVLNRVDAKFRNDIESFTQSR